MIPRLPTIMSQSSPLQSKRVCPLGVMACFFLCLVTPTSSWRGLMISSNRFRSSIDGMHSTNSMLRVASAANSVRCSAMKHLTMSTSLTASERARSEAKQKLLKLVARSKRDLLSDSEVIGAIEELEQMNPCATPAESNLISGPWSLLYTGASAENAEFRRSKEGLVGSAVTEISGASDANPKAGPMPLGRRITTLAGSFIQNKGNYQDIDAAKGQVMNRAILSIAGIPLEICIQGRCSRTSDEAHKATRLDVAFESVRLSIADKITVTVPLGWANGGKGPQGWVDTTYLDEDVRCGRGDKGSVFVTVRRSE